MNVKTAKVLWLTLVIVLFVLSLFYFILFFVSVRYGSGMGYLLSFVICILLGIGTIQSKVIGKIGVRQTGLWLFFTGSMLLVFNYFVNANALPFIYIYLSCILLFIEIFAYVFLTFNPLKNFIFEDPLTHKYGLLGHHHHKH